MSSSTIETRRPPRHALAIEGGLRDWVVSRIKLFADLQVCSASHDARIWLAQRRGSILDVGCGDQPYVRFVPKACHYVAIDQRGLSEDFKMERYPDVTYYSGPKFPVADAAFDSLFHTEVLEHVYETRDFLNECQRVLKPGGEMFFTVPFQARYHFKPHDYFRYTPAALRRMLADAGFADVTVGPRGDDVTVAAYKAAAVGFRWAYGGAIGKALFLLTSPLTILVLCVAHAATALRCGSDDDCLGYSVFARRPNGSA